MESPAEYTNGFENDSDNWDDSLLIQAWNESWTKMQKETSSNMKLPLIHTNKRNRKSRACGKDSSKIWAVNDTCMAIWEEDCCEYYAKILSIDNEKGTAQVVFPEYGNIDTVHINKLRIAAEQEKFTKDEEDNGKTSGDLASSNEDSMVLEDKVGQFSNLQGVCNNSSLNNICESDISTSTNKTSMTSEAFNVTQFLNAISSHLKGTDNNKNNINLPNTVSNGGLPSFMNPTAFNKGSVPPPPIFNLNGLIGGLQNRSDVNAFKKHNNNNINSLMMEGDEALAQMLISWYMTGYHTGYYQGITKAKDFMQVLTCSNISNGGSLISTNKKSKKKNRK